MGRIRCRTLDYVLLPVLLPFSAHGRRMDGGLPVFHMDRLGWFVDIAYSAVLSSAAVWFGRRFNFGKALALFLSIAIVCAVSIHALMWALGCNYWYEIP